MKRGLLVAVALVAACSLPTAATAVVPPKNCGITKVNGKKFQVKADQITCKTGIEYARRYIRSHRKPRGYTCRDITKARNRVNFTCYNGRKTFQGIRR